jgi:hypothetical protein
MSRALAPALLAALALSAAIVNSAAVAQYHRKTPPRIEGCAKASDVIAAEAHNRGHEYRSARIFRDGDAQWLSGQIGMALHGSDLVVLFSYSDGSAGVASLVNAPECWRLQILERRK